MAGESILTIRRQKIDQLAALLIRETGAHADVLQHTRAVEEPEEQGSDHGPLTFFMPAETGHDAIAVPFVLHLEHDAFVRLIKACAWFGHHAVEPRPFEAMKPVRGFS